MAIQSVFNKGLIDNVDLIEPLKNALLLSLSDDDDTPRTVKIGEHEYVVDDGEASVMWSEDALTNSVVYVRDDAITYRKWSVSNGRDATTIELHYKDAAPSPEQALTDFNERLTD